MSLAEELVSRGLPVAVAGAIGTALIVSGCVSTQQKAAWLTVENARTLATQNPTVVRRPDPQVQVTGSSLLWSGGRAAVAVRLYNRSDRALNDLPVSVWLEQGRVLTYLNRRAGLDYFANHLAAIPAHASETWVFTSRQKGRLTGRPFVRVGPPDSTPTSVGGALPAVRASLTGARGSGPLTLAVQNLSSIPQAQVEIYAYAQRGGHDIAAGAASVSNLASGAQVKTRLGLIGRFRPGQVQLEALPTLFH